MTPYRPSAASLLGLAAPHGALHLRRGVRLAQLLLELALRHLERVLVPVALPRVVGGGDHRDRGARTKGEIADLGREGVEEGRRRQPDEQGERGKLRPDREERDEADRGCLQERLA